MKKLALFVCLLVSLVSFGQNTEKVNNFVFTPVADIEATSVGNQNKSSTCWSYSSLSFFESELMRMGKDSVKLAPIFVVRKSYADKVAKYIRMQGTINLGPGGAFHDAAYVIKNYGMVPYSVYKGDRTGDANPVHAELDAMMKSMADIIVQAKNGKKISTVHMDAVNGVLDAYLGKVPEEFMYNGKKYTPKSYAQSLGLNMDDYVAITSFNHHPFYQQFMLEVPDNWQWGMFHNIPVDELRQVMDNALNKGYGIAWASDVSEKGFSWSNGVAIAPATDWDEMDKAEKDTIFNSPSKQLTITDSLRRMAFDNQTTQDDHGMHITGMVKDQTGTVYYKVKNSWGASNKCGGYIYASQAYVLYKTTNILVHKDAIPDAIAKKMGIKK
ncbi:MAG TPA: C1 family peptidase [Bacteroidia bacterium]|nr:C1 family peptidase [Bacteroidia bacterium]